MPSFRLIASALALLAAPLAVHAGIVNGSFETNDAKNDQWKIETSVDGWQTGALGIELRRNVAGKAQAGNSFAELDTTGNSEMWQQVQTELGLDYLLSGFYSPRAGVAADSNDIQVYWNSTLLSTLGGSGVGFAEHQWRAFSFTVAGTGSDKLRFVAAGKSDSYGGSLDQISLTAVPSAVPEPGSMALALLALGAVGVATRRRITAQA